MFTKERIFTAYENPVLAEPTARVVLLREGFSVWAFAFNFFWLIYRRCWLPAIGYLAIVVVLVTLQKEGFLAEASLAVLQFFLNLAVGFFGHDFERWCLTRRGYRFAGVITAESDMMAQRRYYEHAA